MSKARQLAQRTNQSGRKNLFINGAMQVAQRGTSFSYNGNITAYPVDRFLMTVYNTGFATPTGGTSAQVDLTDSDSESLGFSTAIRFTPASDSKLCYLSQKVEDVSRLAGKTITLSYYARVNTGTFTIPNEGRITQNFGSGGSSATNTFASFDDNVLTTSWKRISYSLTLPSVVGKTINAGNNTDVRTFHTADLSSLGWIEITGVQLEVGSVATEFEHRSYGEELALCQRYYYMAANGTSDTNQAGLGFCYAHSDTEYRSAIDLPVEMRTIPSLDSPTVTDGYRFVAGATSTATTELVSSITAAYPAWNTKRRFLISSGTGQPDQNAGGKSGYFQLYNSSTAYVAFDAEL